MELNRLHQIFDDYSELYNEDTHSDYTIFDELAGLDIHEKPRCFYLSDETVTGAG